MRFIQSILQDAHRPVGTGRASTTGQPHVQRAPSDSVGESPAPPMEEQEDGAMTLYRFQKEGAEVGNNRSARKGLERGDIGVDRAHTHSDIPLPAKPNAETQQTASSGLNAAFELNDESMATKQWYESSGNKVASATGSKVIASDKPSNDVFLSIGEQDRSVGEAKTSNLGKDYNNLNGSSTETVENQEDLTNEMQDEMATPDYIARDVPARRGPGTNPPSEFYPSASQGQTPEPAPLDGADSGPRATAAPEQRQANHHAPDEASAQQPIEPTEAYQGDIALRSEPSASSFESRAATEPGASLAPQPPQTPRVQIGQVDVVVVKQGREPKPKAGAKATPSRHLLSRNYLRGL